jgi:hypothetical protein
MPSFQITLTPNRRAAARFIGQVRRALQKAYVEEQANNGLSQSEIARSLKVHRSVINRELKGRKDLTLGRVAELAWAMGRKPSFSIEQPHVSSSTNFPVAAATAQGMLSSANSVNLMTTSQPYADLPSMIPFASAA